MIKLNFNSDFLHTDAVQGDSEARTKLYKYVLLRSTGAADEVMRRELWQSFVALPQKSRQSGGGI